MQTNNTYVVLNEYLFNTFHHLIENSGVLGHRPVIAFGQKRWMEYKGCNFRVKRLIVDQGKT